MTRNAHPPAVLVRFPFEGAPFIRIDAESAEDEARIRAWVNRKPEYLELIQRACQLAERERAA